MPTRFLHDCRHTATRTLSRAIFDRDNIIHEQELLDAGDQLVASRAQQAQAVPVRRRPHAASTTAPRSAAPLRLVRRGTA